MVQGGIRALGTHGGDREAEVLYRHLQRKGGTHKTVTLAAIARMKGPRALAICDEILARIPAQAGGKLLDGLSN